MHINGIVQRFTVCDKGGIAPLFALSCIVLLLVTGVAIDSARFQDLSNRTQAALDGASLAAAKLLEDEDLSISEIQDRAVKYFNAAVPTFGIHTTYISPLDVAVDRSDNSVETAVQMHIPSFFGRIAGGSGTVTMNRSSKVVYDMQKVELALVLDVTGSMLDKNKIGDMKAAAEDVIEALLDDSINENNTRIALAPFSASVNAGPYRSSVADTAAPNTVADDCVIDRANTTDAPPSGADRLPLAPLAPSYQMYSCPDAPVVALSGKSQKQMLIDTINGYNPSGWTAGHIGAAWGQYLLSPNWSGVFTGANAPNPIDPNKVIKAVVIMTDGEFNTAYLNGDTDPNDVTQAQAAKDLAYTQFQQICTAMKDEGIRVFTVGYDLPDPSRALSELETCATAGDFYVAAAGNLKKVFRDISETLTALRVSG